MVLKIIIEVWMHGSIARHASTALVWHLIIHAIGILLSSLLGAVGVRERSEIFLHGCSVMFAHAQVGAFDAFKFFDEISLLGIFEDHVNATRRFLDEHDSNRLVFVPNDFTELVFELLTITNQIPVLRLNHTIMRLFLNFSQVNSKACKHRTYNVVVIKLHVQLQIPLLLIKVSNVGEPEATCKD